MTAQIKLKHSGGNGVIIEAPASNPASDKTITLPSDETGVFATKNSANNQSLEIVADKVQNIEDKLSITNEDSAQNMDTVTDQISLLDREVENFGGIEKGISITLKKMIKGSIHLKINS